MSRSARFVIRFFDGPYDGRVRRVSRVPYELARPIAVPLRNEAKNGKADCMAIYQLKNDNGNWRYDYLRSATADVLGVEGPARRDDSYDAALDACETAVMSRRR